MDSVSPSEFKATFREGIDRVARPLGYVSRRKAATSWSRTCDQDRTSFEVRHDSRAVDTYQGGQLSIEFEHAPKETPRLGLNGRAFFDQLLTHSELERELALQNSVIASLPRPPAGLDESHPATRAGHGGVSAAI